MNFFKNTASFPEFKNYAVNLFAQLIGRFVSIGSQLLVFLYVARKLGVESFGKFAYFLTFVNVLATVSDFGTGGVASKDLARLPEYIRPRYWGNVLILRGTFNIITALIGCVLAFVLRSDMHRELIVGAICVPFASSRIFDPIFQIYNKPQYSSIASGIYGINYAALSMVILLFYKASVFQLALVYLLSNAIYLVVAYCLSLKLVKPVFIPEMKLIKQNLKIAVPMGLASLFTIINSRADTFMLAWFKNDWEVGIYNAAYKIVDMFALGMVLLLNPLVPVFSRKASISLREFTYISRRIFEYMLFFLPVLLIVTPYISDFFMVSLYGPEYVESARALNILMWVCVLICLSLFSMVVCLSIDLVHFGWWNAALAAAINIFLNYLWIPEYGFIGSCWATLICEVVLLGITLGYLVRRLPQLFSLVFVARYSIFLGIWIILKNFLFKKIPPYGVLYISVLSYLLLGVVILYFQYLRALIFSREK